MNQNNPQTVFTPGRALTPKAQRSAILGLKHKIREVIALTPEVRSGKVQVMKELIAKDSYRVDSQQLAANLIADHFMMTGCAACQPGTGLQSSEPGINAPLEARGIQK
jgi:hypothetical protein